MLKKLLFALLLLPALAWGQTTQSIDDFPEQASPATSDWLLIDEGSGVFKSASVSNVVDARATGKQVIWVPAGAMTPMTTNGSADLATTEINASSVDISTLDYDGGGGIERAYFWVSFPDAWDEDDVSFRVYWTTTATDTDAVHWILQSYAISDDEALSQTIGTTATVTDAAQGAANELLVSDESSAGTVGGTPASGDAIIFQVIRSSGNAADTMTEDAKLIGVKLYWTTDAPTE